MQESLIGSAVNTISSATAATADALAGSSTAATAIPSGSDSGSSVSASSRSPSSSATATPTVTTGTPIAIPAPSVELNISSTSSSSSFAIDTSSNDTNSGTSIRNASSSDYACKCDSSTEIEVDVGDGGLGWSSGCVIVIALSVFALLIGLLSFWYYRHKCRVRKSPSIPSCIYVTSEVIPSEDQPHATAILSPFNTKNLENSSSSSGSRVLQTSLWEDEVIIAARIPLEKLATSKLISYGGHGQVYRGTYHGSSVAIKRLLPQKRKELHEVNSFLAEIKMMASVEHPRIVRFIGVAWDSLSDLCAVSEFMGGGDLHSLLTRFEETEHRPHGFDFEKARIALQTAQALAYLHSLDPIVLHRDLKSMNILLTPKLDAKITDFGVSRQWSVDTMTAGVGTVLWMAPEVMLGKHYDSSADIFSFGIVLSELDSHLPPYREVWGPKSGRKISDTALLQLVSSGQLSIEFSSNAPQELVDLGHACVDLDPTARPSANEVLYQLQLILQIYEAYTM